MPLSLPGNRQYHLHNFRSTGVKKGNPPHHSIRPEPYIPRNRRLASARLELPQATVSIVGSMNFIRRKFCCNTSVLRSGLMSHLPRSVHLVAEAPEFDVVWIFVTVGFSQITVVGAALEVAFSTFLASSGPRFQVNGHHNIHCRLFRPVRKLIQTEFVCLNHAPGKIRFCVCLRAYAVFPVIARDKARPGGRSVPALDKIQGIFSKPCSSERALPS